MHAEQTVGLHLLGQYSRIPSFLPSFHGQAPSYFGATSSAWELASGVIIFAIALSGEIVLLCFNLASFANSHFTVK
jgi:hypothetical protein